MVKRSDDLMPTIEASLNDLKSLIKVKGELDELLMFAKSEIDEIRGDTIKLDVKDTNRPDLWSIEGIVREIRIRFTKSIPCYSVEQPILTVFVDKCMKKIRPYTVCAVVKSLSFNETIISQMIQLQEKISTAYGRNRKDVAIGVYDFNRIKGNIRFTAFGPNEIKFAPLDFDEEMTLEEIIQKHPKGKEYGHLLTGLKKYPIFIDDSRQVLSMPPIINSNYTGKVDIATKNVFIECSGFDFNKLMLSLNVLVCALAERGGKIYSCDVIYADKKIITPDLKPKEVLVDPTYILRISGVHFDNLEELIKASGYNIRKNGKTLILEYPAYRNDIMHQRDVVEDVLISYGYNNLMPKSLEISTIGSVSKIVKFSEKLKDLAIGAGFQEIMTYTLTNKQKLFEKMCVAQEPVVEIANPISANWAVFRSWLLPSLLEFLSKNKHNEYPQLVFELGLCVVPDKTKETCTRDEIKLGLAITNTTCDYHEILSRVDFILKNLGLEYRLKKCTHNSYIPGRAALIVTNRHEVGYVGEIHPKVLENWKLETPVCAAELSVNELLNLYKSE